MSKTDQKISLCICSSMLALTFSKKNRRSQKRVARQQGVALIMLMLIIALAFTVLAVNYFSPETKRLHLEQQSQEVLSEAKEALIAYAVTRYEQDPGVFTGLPCTDTGISLNSPEGVQEPNCGNNNANAVGRLPWRTLNIGPLRDASGECLWYAVSGPYKTNPSAPLLNEDSPGLLRLYSSDGVTELTANNSQRRIVAAVIAPGPAISGQSRDYDSTTECGGNYNAADFLESVGSAANAGFNNTPHVLDGIAQGDKNSESNPNLNARINDRIITITRQEIWNRVRNRPFPNVTGSSYNLYSSPASDIFDELTRELAQCLADFVNVSQDDGRRALNDFRLPWAVPVDLGEPTNQLYSQQTNYKDNSGTYGGRLPFDLTESMEDIGQTESDSPYPLPGTLFVEGRCTKFVDLSDLDPPASLPTDPTFPLYRNLWNHWKDHIFYAVSAAFSPNADDPAPPPAPPVACTPPGPGRDCLSVNGVGDYAAIVIFANSRLEQLGQSRDGPPDNDDKANALNYLELGNDDDLISVDGFGDYANITANPNFNDILYCVRLDPNLPDLIVEPCPI